jgi:signal peptidase S26 family
MTPTLEPGDRLLVDTAAYRARPPAIGDLVVFPDPESSGRLLVKRVAGAPTDPGATGGSIPPGGVFVVGDAPHLSRDSRAFGPVPVGRLVGQVWFRYGPAARRGPLAPGTVK